MHTQTAASRCKSPYCATLSRAHNSSISAMLGKEVFHGPAALWRLSGLKNDNFSLVFICSHWTPPNPLGRLAGYFIDCVCTSVYWATFLLPQEVDDLSQCWFQVPSLFFYFYFSKLSSIKQVQDQFFPLPQSHWQVLSRIPSLSPCSR